MIVPQEAMIDLSNSEYQKLNCNIREQKHKNLTEQTTKNLMNDDYLISQSQTTANNFLDIIDSYREYWDMKADNRIIHRPKNVKSSKKKLKRKLVESETAILKLKEKNEKI